MSRQRIMIFWAMAAIALPVFAAHAADATRAAPTPVVKASLAVTPPPAAPVPSQVLHLDSRPAGLSFKVNEPAPALRPDDFRFGLADRSASTAALNLTPVINSARTGWHFSGRMGPLRWMTPLAGEGETTMRLGGRVPGQPGVSGMGTYHISLHYAFE